VLTLAHPWLFLLLPLPLLMRWLLPAHREERTSVRAPFFDQLARQTGLRPSPGAVVLRRTLAQKILLPLCWLLLVAAAVQPQWVGEPIEQIESARDLMLVVDLSGSMEIRDFVGADGDRVDRLTAVKGVLRDFVARRETDRLGLVVFGNAAFVQVPFTLDHAVFLELLDEVQVGMAGPQTMLGDALGLAIKAFDASDADQRTVILLTDGNDTGSGVPPVKAAELAAQRGLTVHVIGVGDPAAAGEAPLDEATLGGIADATGGRFFRAEDRSGLDIVYAEIDALEPLDFETVSFRPTFELYFWPLGAFLVLALAYHLVAAGRTGLVAMRNRSSSLSSP
jgi:Ca-activated chloride channel family protein